jgi:hypothetical protein
MEVSPEFISRATLLAFLLIVCGVRACTASSQAVAHPVTPSRFGNAKAVASREVAVHETVAARLVNHRGATYLNERGQGSGTFQCPLTIQISITYTRASITFNCATQTGKVGGGGETAFYASGHTAHFNGTLHITHGSGSYAHASAENLHITGTLRRGSYALAATVTGTMRS